MTPTEKLRAMLDERGVEWKDDSPVPSMKPWKTSFTSFTGEEVTLGCYDEPKWIMGTMVFHTPEQAIAATVGNRTDLSKRLREVHGLHAFAELFGFDWSDESDWSWHDVACAMADAIDATVGNTCQAVLDPTYYKGIHGYCQSLKCSKCGEPLFKEFRSCPWCGSKVVSA